MAGSIEWVGLQAAIARVQRLRARVRDLTPAWQAIDKSVSVMFRRRFETGGRVGGGSAWARLRPATRRARQRPGGNRGGLERPLWHTGRLKASLEKVGPESVRVIRPHEYQRGTRVPSARFHQTGWTATQWGGRPFRRPRRVPARPPIPDPVDPVLVRTWTRFVAQYIARERGGD